MKIRWDIKHGSENTDVNPHVREDLLYVLHLQPSQNIHHVICFTLPPANFLRNKHKTMDPPLVYYFVVVIIIQAKECNQH